MFVKFENLQAPPIHPHSSACAHAFSSLRWHAAASIWAKSGRAKVGTHVPSLPSVPSSHSHNPSVPEHLSLSKLEQGVAGGPP